MQKHQDSLSGRVGGSSLIPLAGAEVRVTSKASGLPASLYADNGITPISQPLITDANGNYAFYAADGKYVITFSGARFNTFTREIILEDPADNPYATLAQLSAPTGTTLINHEGTPLNTFLNAITGGGSAAVTSVNGVAPVAGNVALTADNIPEAGTPTNRYFSSARVLAVVLSGLSTASSAAIAATDTVLDAFGKLQAQLNSMLASKDASGGYAGLTGFALNLKNAAGSVLSNLASSATTARTWTFPDKSGTVAMTSDITGGSLTLLGTDTVSTAKANIDFLSLFSDTYSKYVIEVENVVPSASDNLSLRVAIAGAAATGASDYYSAVAGDGVAMSTASAIALSSGGFTTLGMDATIEIRNARSTSAGVKSISARGRYAANGLFREAAVNRTQAISGIRLYWASGSNFTAGTVRVYGVKNA